MLKIRDNVDLKELEKYGYFKSHVTVFSTAIVKQVDDEHVVEICMEEPSYNMWTGKDWKRSRIIVLYHCKKIEAKCKNKILLEPGVEEHLYYEKDYGTWEESRIIPFIQDLIKADLVEKVDE